MAFGITRGVVQDLIKRNRTMTQRIFDVDNPQDVKDLFDILPDKITKIVRNLNAFDCYDKDENYLYSWQIFSINWRNKTKITRPVDETKLIGCLCWFADSGATCEYIGILNAIDENRDNKYQMKDGARFSLCRPVRRNEIKFVEGME